MRFFPQSNLLMFRILSLPLLLFSLGFPTPIRAQDAALRFPEQVWQQYATPEDAGFSSAGVERARQFADSLGSASVMLVYRGAVVAAWGDITRPDHLASISKSIQNALLGNAVGKGLIDLDSTLEQLGIDDQPGLLPTERRARVRDLLTMRSGVLHNAAFQLWLDSSPELERPAPGTAFQYSNWNVNALNLIYEQQTGESFVDAVERLLAEPLQFEDFDIGYVGLWRNPRQSSMPNPQVFLSTRDMARFGLLYLRRGRWKEQQIMPAEWVEESTRAHADAGPYAHFGYLWWVPKGRLAEHRAFLASGTGNQSIIILPQEEIVFVHRASALGGGVHGLQVYEVLYRLLEARTGRVGPAPALVPFDPSR